MYKVAIVEDNQECQKQLQSMLEQYGKENGCAFSAECFGSGVDFISDYTPSYDLVFMDIDMPRLNGMATAKMMRKLDDTVTLVFVTNLAKYAISGYDVGAVAFIVKPLNFATFSLKMRRILKHVKEGEEPYLTVSTKKETSKVLLADILYITVLGRYVLLHTKTGNVEMHTSMKALEKELESQGFVRGDNSSMVNLKYVTAVNDKGAVIDGEVIPCSRNRKKALMDAFTCYLR